MRDESYGPKPASSTVRMPWANEVALTRPYYDDSKAHVLAAPPGENAWLVAIERVLEANRSQVGPLLARAGT